ncbi:MAG: thiamine monophosphate synthase [Alphaproteobacteria bacterium]|nr:MAG: thiamine monophosphate synthase [Alphaproteobacteria bacterium]
MVRGMTLTDIAKRLNEDHSLLPPVFFMTDQQAVSAPVGVISRLPPGAAVIFRDYHHPERDRLGADLAVLCRDRGLIFLVAGDAGLAVKLKADGVHLPEGLMAEAAVLRASHPEWMLTVSCHDLAAVRRAEKIPLDAALVGPVFPTHSHPETLSGEKPTLGLSGVRQMTAATSLPLYALGGITEKNASQLTGTGVVGIAAIRGFMSD